MPYNKGFRVFNLRWIVSSISTTGSTYDNDDPTSGKIINSNNTFGYTDDKWGVKRCLEDFCAPLFTTEDNGEGWQLDTDLCPNNEAVNLIPNVRVWALFFKHTTGARLMMGLNYFGMASFNSDPSVDPPVYSSSSDRYYDIGFLGTKTNYQYYSTFPTPSSTSQSVLTGGGLFMSMIPPAVNGETQDVFHPDISIKDVAFYPQTMTPIQYQKFGRTGVVTGSSSTFNRQPILCYCTSFIKQGTNDTSTDYPDTYTKSQEYGVVLGKTIKLSLFVCEEVVGFIGFYNNTTLMGSQVCGRILSDCRQTDDTLSTAEYGTLSMGGSINNSGSSNYYLWNDSYNQLSVNRCCNTTGTFWPEMYAGYQSNGYIASSSIETTFEYIYSGFVYGYDSSHPISPNGQTKAKLRSDLFRFVNESSQKLLGQTYNDNTWCFYGSTNYSSTQPPTAAASLTSGMFIKWDGAFNGTQTISGLN